MIEHLSEIEYIRQVEANYKKEKGTPVCDISHWNPGEEYIRDFINILSLPRIEFDPKYIYSYELPQKLVDKVEKKIGTSNYPSSSVVFFQNGTIAECNVINFLSAINKKKICIIDPAYFNVEYIMQRMGFDVDHVSLEFTNNKFVIPEQIIQTKKYNAVWITSPVYSSGYYFDDKELNKIRELLDSGITVITDECVTMLGKEVFKIVKPHQNLISIFCPHKSIIMNSAKFAVVLFDSCYEDIFNTWIDILSGGLLPSNILAINHFVSPNYEKCLNFMQTYTNSNLSDLKQIFCDRNKYCYIDQSIGQYCTISYREISYEESSKRSFIRRLINETGISLIPGYLNGYNAKFDFCFRINLALNKNDLKTKILLLDNYLRNQ